MMLAPEVLLTVAVCSSCPRRGLGAVDALAEAGWASEGGWTCPSCCGHAALSATTTRMAASSRRVRAAGPSDTE